MNPKISIIVPVYNVEKYIRECLDSITKQTFPDWECLLIDDGSLDNSGAICDEYAIKDSRFKIFHKPNGGVSSARNFGIDKAQGEWVTFVDGDDILLNTYIKSLLRPVVADPDIEFVHGGGTNWTTSSMPTIVFKVTQYIGEDSCYLFNNFQGFICSKLFRRDIIMGKKGSYTPLVFDEKIKIAEDFIFTLDYIARIKKYAFVEEYGYLYRRDNGMSATKTLSNYKYESSLESYKHRRYSILKYVDIKGLKDEQCVQRYREAGNILLNMCFALYRYGVYSRAERLFRIQNDLDDIDLRFLSYTPKNSIKGFLAHLLSRRSYNLFDIISDFLCRFLKQ